jgi:TRAP-type C4-dicarboxylate transport system permease small subunit
MRKLSTIFARVGGGLILISALMVFVDVLLRKLFATNLFESFELSGYGFAIAYTFSLAFALLSKAHIRIDVIRGRFGPRWRGVLDVSAAFVIALVAIFFAYFAWRTTNKSFVVDARSFSQLGTPLAIPQFFWALGFSWFAIVASWLAASSLIALSRSDFPRVDRLAGMDEFDEPNHGP